MRRLREEDLAPEGGREGPSAEELVGAVSRLRYAAAMVIEGLIDLLDEIEGDPDLEPEADEPNLATAEDGNTAGRSWCVDGEVDEVEETSVWPAVPPQ